MESNDGRELEARILSFDGETVRIQTRSRDVFTVPLSRFSGETIDEIEKWQREIGRKLTTLEDLRDEFVKSLEEGIRLREGDVPPFTDYFSEPRPVYTGSSRRAWRTFRREREIWHRRRESAASEYREILTNAFPGLEIRRGHSTYASSTWYDPRPVVRDGLTMKGTDLFNYIRNRSDDEDFFLNWFRGNPRPYRELKEKFSDFRKKLDENPTNDPKATAYQAHIDQILEAMDEIIKSDTSDVARRILRTQINENLEVMGIK